MKSFKLGLPFFWKNVFTNFKLLKGLFPLISFFLLTYVSLKASLDQKDVMIFLEAVGNFLFMIDYEFYEVLVDIRDKGLSFFRILALIGAIYMWRFYLSKLAHFIRSGMTGESTTLSIAYTQALFVIVSLQYIYSLVSTFVLGINDELYLPLFDSGMVILTLLFGTDMISSNIERLIGWNKG